jgi:hypothetical protein
MQLRAFTENSKTILSVDFNRDFTCEQKCEYCYVENMERIYSAYLNKITRNAQWATENPQGFAQQLNTEYTKLTKSKAKSYKRLGKMPVRLYGSGDFKPKHLEFIQNLDFKFFIISKNLTKPEYYTYISQLLKTQNVTKILLSFDNANLQNYIKLGKLFGKDRIGFCYTGMADEFNEVTEPFNVFFNISKKQKERAKSRLIKEQCPCDSGVLAHKESCSYCSKCWRSSITNIRNG